MGAEVAFVHGFPEFALALVVGGFEECGHDFCAVFHFFVGECAAAVCRVGDSEGLAVEAEKLGDDGRHSGVVRVDVEALVAGGFSCVAPVAGGEGCGAADIAFDVAAEVPTERVFSRWDDGGGCEEFVGDDEEAGFDEGFLTVEVSLEKAAGFAVG